MEFYRESHCWRAGPKERLMHSGKSHTPSVKHPEVWEDVGQVGAFPPMGCLSSFLWAMRALGQR